MCRPEFLRFHWLLAVACSRGQNVVEYGMIIAAVAIVVLLGVTTFGSEIRPWFEHLTAGITTVGT
jgi:Flp pilus assembly pilin Flp